MTPELGVTGWQYETIDVNIVPDLYVTWIVDIWKGDPKDPTVDVNRYIAVWSADALEDENGNAVDPEFKNRSYYNDPFPTIEPLHWQLLASVKKSDPAAKKFKQDQTGMLDPEAYAYGSNLKRKTRYQNMMDAIEILANQDAEDEAAWAAIEAFRQHRALEYEK